MKIQEKIDFVKINDELRLSSVDLSELQNVDDDVVMNVETNIQCQ